jgi:hypothetical protein
MNVKNSAEIILFGVLAVVTLVVLSLRAYQSSAAWHLITLLADRWQFTNRT